MKLNRASLADKAGWAAAHVALPQYDVAAVAEATKKAPAWVHFGTGNIFRAYIAALAQRMLNEGLTDKGLLMANTNDPAILDIAYTPFDNLCIAVTLNPDATTSREIIGSIAEGIKADSSNEAAMARFKEVFTDPGLQMLSFTITEKGYGKRTPVEEYRITNRGGLGIKNYQITDKTGKIVGVKVVDGTEDLLLMTQSGILIRTPVENIKETANRATQGVIVMRFKEEGDQVISMALAEHEDTEDVSAEAEISTEISANEENSTAET